MILWQQDIQRTFRICGTSTGCIPDFKNDVQTGQSDF